VLFWPDTDMATLLPRIAATLQPSFLSGVTREFVRVLRKIGEATLQPARPKMITSATRPSGSETREGRAPSWYGWQGRANRIGPHNLRGGRDRIALSVAGGWAVRCRRARATHLAGAETAMEQQDPIFSPPQSLTREGISAT
jgi:hypothetical protein